MGRGLLPVLLLLWCAGCSAETESSPASSPGLSKTTPPTAQKPFSREPMASTGAPPPPTAEKPAAKPEPAGTPSGPRVDQFNLPLEIHIETPEVPPEIQGPSPPIKEEPKTD